MINPNCDGSGPCNMGEVRVLPTGGDSNGILCRACYERELMSLYEEIKGAGIPFDHHESDLYFKRTPESMAILAKYPLQKDNARGFSNEAPPNVGERWIDVPFAYQPFWDKARRAK